MLLEEFNFKTEVLDAPGPVLVDFWATWCPPCKTMNPVVEKLAGEFKVCKVDIDKNQSLAAKFGVNAVPTFIVFRNGQPTQRIEGAVPEATLRAALAG
jgi:thioredoxin